MDVNDTNKHNPIIARTLNQMATTSAPTLPHVTMSAANVAATGEGTDINAFDATQVWLNKEEMLEARISEFQARGLRSIIIMLFKKAKTSTALYHLVAKFRLASTPPSFHSTSDFHHTLMTTYKHWTRCVQRAHTTWRRERSSRERSDGTCVVPESIPPTDFWQACYALNAQIRRHGQTLVDKKDPYYQLPLNVLNCFHGTNGERRNLWMFRWRRCGYEIRDEYSLMVPPKEMENWFYQISSVEMITNWSDTRDFDVAMFLKGILDKQHTATRIFKAWFFQLMAHSWTDGGLDTTADENEKIQKIVDGVTLKMARTIINTKLKALRMYRNAGKNRQSNVAHRSKLAAYKPNALKEVIAIKTKQTSNDTTNSSKTCKRKR